MPKRPKAPPPPALPIQPAGMAWRFEILGAPATKKNSKRAFVNETTGAAFIANGETSRAWEKSAVWNLISQWHRAGAINQPVRMSATIYRKRATGDLLNYLAAVSDALEKAGVVTNDRWIVSLDGCRLDKDASNPRVVVDVTTI